MADYHIPTVIQPTIPNADMTPLERLVLGHIFDAETDGEGTYFFAEIGPCDCFDLPVDRSRAACAQSVDVPSTLHAWLTDRLDALAGSDTSLTVDFSVNGWGPSFRILYGGREASITSLWSPPSPAPGCGLMVSAGWPYSSPLRPSRANPPTMFWRIFWQRPEPPPSTARTFCFDFGKVPSGHK